MEVVRVYLEHRVYLQRDAMPVQMQHDFDVILVS